MNLSQHDSRLISAAIGYLLAITGSGSEGAVAMGSITRRNSVKMLKHSTEVLAVAKEGMAGTDVAQVSADTFEANLDRLQEIAKGLMGDTEPVTAVAEVSTVEPIDADGKATGPKQYQLWITHEEIHALYHAITAVEALQAADVLTAYESVKQYAMYAEEVETFATKFNQVHEAARVDGEVADKTTVVKEINAED